MRHWSLALVGQDCVVHGGVRRQPCDLIKSSTFLERSKYITFLLFADVPLLNM